MTKTILVLLLLTITVSFPPFVFAETILLKSGQKIEGKIIEKTDKYINVEIAGTSQPYFLDDIESIDGEPFKINQASVPGNVNPDQDIKSEQEDYYIDKNGDFKIIPPKGFDKVDIIQEGFVKFTNPENPYSFFIVSCLYAPYEQFQAKLENEAARREFINSMIGEMTNGPAKFISSRKREINGISAWEFTLEREAGYGQFVIKSINFNKNNKQFAIMFTVKEDSFDTMQNYFEDSIVTLEVF
jgi:hypothetical protein